MCLLGEIHAKMQVKLHEDFFLRGGCVKNWCKNVPNGRMGNWNWQISPSLSLTFAHHSPLCFLSLTSYQLKNATHFIRCLGYIKFDVYTCFYFFPRQERKRTSWRRLNYFTKLFLFWPKAQPLDKGEICHYKMQKTCWAGGLHFWVGSSLNWCTLDAVMS